MPTTNLGLFTFTAAAGAVTAALVWAKVVKQKSKQQMPTMSERIKINFRKDIGLPVPEY
jgi:hypothetical protein